jgi:hypothetical protein
VNPEVLARLNWYRLPPLIQAIRARCGADVALALLEHCENRRIHVPMPNSRRASAPGNPLAALDAALVERLAREYPGAYLHIPRAYHALLGLRDEDIRAQRRAGRHPDDLAREYHLTPRWIWRIVAGIEPRAGPGQQETLF